MQRHSQHAAIIAGTLPVTRDIREATVVAVLLACELALGKTVERVYIDHGLWVIEGTVNV
jgi:2-methylcitrate dehydratase PrpD